MELFDTQFRIYDDEPEKKVDFTSANLKIESVGPSIALDGAKMYASAYFFLIEKGTLYKRRVYTIFNLLENFGGIEEAIVLVFAPLAAGIAARSFNYNLVQ